MSSFTVEPCTAVDMPAAFAMVSDTFEHEQPYHDALWPDHWTAEGRVPGTERFIRSLQTEPDLKFLKAVDADGTMAGVVRYYVLGHDAAGNKKQFAAPALDGAYFADNDAHEYAQHLCTQYLRRRTDTVASDSAPFVCLDMLTIHPSFQSRGAGSALVKWGTDLADSMDAEATVESSLAGLNVYKKFGYRVVEEVTLPVPEKWADRPVTHFWFMRRERPKNKAN